MKRPRIKSNLLLWFLICVLFFFSSACNDSEKDKENYSGVGGLIAERNKARYDVAEKPPAKKAVTKKSSSKKSDKSKSKADELAMAILYEQKVKIVGSDSGRTLANGVAYINKKGQIVRITILKE